MMYDEYTNNMNAKTPTIVACCFRVFETYVLILTKFLLWLTNVIGIVFARIIASEWLQVVVLHQNSEKKITAKS